MFARSIAPLAAALALAVPIAAQCSSGPFLAAPFGLSMADDPGSSFVGGFSYMKPVGFQTSAPGPWQREPGWPAFRMDTVFRLCGLAQGPYPDIDAMSLGEDWILADDSTGRIVVDPLNWGGLTFSVTRTTRGAPGSAIRASSSGTNGAAAEVFSWILPGSAMPADLVGRTEALQRSREIDVGAGQRDVDALDFAMSQWRLDVPLRAMLEDPPTWYFSFSTATLGLTDPSWWGTSAPSGATIFRIDWLPTVGRWTCPQVFKTYAELGLGVNEDVDALAFDERNQRLLFSTKTRSRDPLLFLFCGTDVPVPVPYSDGAGVPVSGPIGLIDDDDIDAICAIDPSVRSRPNAVNAFWFAMGTPRDKSFGFPAVDVASSAFRTYDAAGAGFDTFVSGWPANGPGHGFAALFLSLTVGPLTLYPVAVFNRDAADPVCGNPIVAHLRIPPVLALHGDSVDLRWFVTDQGVTSIGEAYPIRIQL